MIIKSFTNIFIIITDYIKLNFQLDTAPQYQVNLLSLRGSLDMNIISFSYPSYMKPKNEPYKDILIKHIHDPNKIGFIQIHKQLLPLSDTDHIIQFFLLHKQYTLPLSYYHKPTGL